MKTELINRTDYNSNLHTRPVGKFENFNFFIDEYQRGYKWTAQQVMDLLNDINDYDPKKEIFYCLQPLAVKLLVVEKAEKYFNKNHDYSYEVIDGQQRLTTIHIILSVINSSIYQINYQTRKSSAKFLDCIIPMLEPFSISYSNSVRANEKAITEQWNSFSKANREFNNIDCYHFFGAYLIIKSWFGQKKPLQITQFEDKLLLQTRFIWYEDDKEENSKAVFRNLNSGKIALTNSELIKAIFINDLRNDNREVQFLRQSKLASEWDTIEQKLQDDKFWFFISNETDKSKYETRIDYLFELIVGKNKVDKLFTYHQYSSGRFELDWSKVKFLFLKLREWYKERRTYHLVGYIVYAKIKSLKEILDETEDLGKKEFRKKLEGYIAGSFKEKKDEEYIYDLNSLNYETSYNQTFKLLLLFNIETYQISEAQYRFPFDKFKNEKWSLEHIHAQNAESIDTIKDLRIWINELKLWPKEIEKRIIKLNELDLDQYEASEIKRLKSHLDYFRSSVDPIVKDLEKTITNQDLKDEIDEAQKKLLNESLELTKDIMNVHKIDNMALLDSNTNSGLGKRRFLDKRNYILSVDQKQWNNGKGNKHFVPICTKNVFLKYYTQDVKHLEFWGFTDRSNYRYNIQRLTAAYLPKS
ncbi:DUF262 domain-containing protein [Christiangramia echinicola]|uniref:DUF262 domain-containing protein n=1 Tax=Christiangramia echinicola TaxID=279359 RepID=UPI0003FE162B|nr:DUF262 domain-containing protein [Christiangramia echinicola]